MSSKGYIVAEFKLDKANPEAAALMDRYREQATAAVHHHGGRFVVRGGVAEVLEGAWTPPERLIVVEFDSVEQAKQFYASPEYQNARKMRENAGHMNLLVISGPDQLL